MSDARSTSFAYRPPPLRLEDVTRTLEHRVGVHHLEGAAVELSGISVGL